MPFDWSPILDLLSHCGLSSAPAVAVLRDPVSGVGEDLPSGIGNLQPTIASCPRELAMRPELLINLSAAKEDHLSDMLGELFQLVGNDGSLIIAIELDPSRSLVREEATNRLIKKYGHCFRIAGAKSTTRVFARVARKKPLAMLFLGQSGSGKTISAIELASSGFSLVHGDQLLLEIAMEKMPSSAALKDIALIGYKAQNWGRSIRNLFQSGKQHEFLLCASAFRKGEPMIFDMWVPEEEQASFVRLFQENGYKVIVCSAN